MQEFKVGDTVLVEMEVSEIGDTRLPYRVGRDGVFFRVDKVYPIPTKTYEDGLAEAWEAARKIAYYDDSDPDALTDEKMEEIFGMDDERHIFMRYTAQEVIEKIAAWKDTQPIKTGDVVVYEANGLKGLVLDVRGECCQVLWESGKCAGFLSMDNLVKTGRTADIAGLLAEIGGAEWVN